MYASFVLLALVTCSDGAAEYYGKYIGPLKTYYHGVTGDVYAVDAKTLHIRAFTYDGEGPAAYFYVGSSKSVSANGQRLLDERGQSQPLKRYRRKHITITLPEGHTLSNIKWFSVYCDEAAVNFADVKMPKVLDFPRPQKIAPLAGVHAVSSEPMVIVDAQTLLIPSFSYDGEAPDAKFWVGRGGKPSPQGVRVPDENGKEVPLRRYDRKTIVLTLPGDLTVFDIGHFGIWCEAFTVDFGHVQIPAGLNVPPSLKMLGVSPQSKLNCEVLHEDLAFEVRWAIAGDSIVVQLVAKLEDGDYMSFGLSGHERENKMIGGDVVVAWMDHSTLNGNAVDSYLEDKSQCSGGRGSCPDFRINPNNTDSVRPLNAALVNGYSIITYQRTLRAHDELDLPIFTNRSQAIIWAVGPLNQLREVSFHSVWSKEDILFNFGRTPKWNCPIPESDAALASTQEEPLDEQTPAKDNLAANTYQAPPPPAPAVRQSDAWEIPPIQCNEPDDGVFYAQMGPTGGKRGYPSITKHVGWGIAYYINGLLIPEINVVRGKTYTFVVEGGLDPSVPAKHHPFYITDDPVGGYGNKNPEEQQKARIFAGVDESRSGSLVPTGTGRLCNWTPDPEQPPADEFVSFGAYQRTLTLICDHGEPGVIQWTPDEDTPDVVYYQCFTHRYLGWKINVHDRCDLPEAAASAHVESRVNYEDEVLQPHSSVRVSTRVKPDGPNYLPLVSGGPLKHRELMDEYKKNFAQIPVNFEDTNLQQYSRPPSGAPTNHKYPASTVDVYTSTEGVREMIPVSEDILEDTVTERSRPIGHNVSEVRFQGHTNRHSRPQGPGTRASMRRPVVSTMTIIRPHRRPAPNRHMVLVAKPRPVTLVASPSQYRPVFVKKPIYRLPAMPMNRPLIATAQPHRPEAVMVPQRAPSSQHISKTVSVSYSSSKGKGKPQSPSRPKGEPAENKKYIFPQQNPIKQEQSVNNFQVPSSANSGGFNPGSIVIEGGFKPIIQNTQEAQDRISEVEDDVDDTVGTIRLSQNDELPTDISTDTKATEYFEPMFIPSPPDSLIKHTKKPTGLEYDILQKKKPYISRKPVRQNMVVIRRRPVSPSLRSEDIDAMAAERMDTYYLPPSGPVYGLSRQVSVPATLLTYDGKPVSANNVVPPPRSPGTGSKKKSSLAELVRNTPQFGPFRGDFPPPIPHDIRPENIPQLKSESNLRPTVAAALRLRPGPTHLSSARKEKEEQYRLLPAASELKEYKYESDHENTTNWNNTNQETVIVLQDTLGKNNISAASELSEDIYQGTPETRNESHVQKRDRRFAPSVEDEHAHHTPEQHTDHTSNNETSPNNGAWILVASPVIYSATALYSLHYWL